VALDNFTNNIAKKDNFRVKQSKTVSLLVVPVLQVFFLSLKFETKSIEIKTCILSKLLLKLSKNTCKTEVTKICILTKIN